MSRDRYLVVGADSTIGSALMHRLKTDGHAVLGTTRRESNRSDRLIPLDLAVDLKRWRPPGSIRAAVFCAAETRLAACRRDPNRSSRINVHGTIQVARRLLENGTQPILLSTNLVFDGSQAFTAADAPVCPQCAYGRQKAEAERWLSALGENTTILRLTKVVSPHFRLMHQWRERLIRQVPIEPFSDFRFSPIFIDDVIELLVRIVRGHGRGIWQLSGDRDLSYADLAGRLADRLGADRGLVNPIPVAAADVAPEHLPRYTTLDSRRIAEVDMALPSSWAAIDRMMTDGGVP